MIYLSGVVRDNLPEGVGVMLTPNMGNILNRPLPWAADTGCFTQPDSYDDGDYLDWLADRDYPAHCLFATAPDVVGDCHATWKVAAPMLPRIRQFQKAALVAQDGLKGPPWSEFDCLFIGGSTAWKLSEEAYDLAREASRRGKWTHMGRVNSWRRFKAAKVSGYDSVDGTYLRFGPDTLLPRVRRWISEHVMVLREPDA